MPKWRFIINGRSGAWYPTKRQAIAAAERQVRRVKNETGVAPGNVDFESDGK